MAGSSEPQREREVQRYLQTWQVAQGSSFNVALNVDSIAAEHLHGNGYTPQASSDKALTAFAQLAVLRLNVRRAMVSLIDGSTQVILTEATRSVRLDPLDASPQPSRTTNSSSQSSANNIMAEDDLWLGTSILSRSDAMCEHALTSSYTSHEADGQPYTTSGLVVSDSRLDPRFERRPYVASEPGIRFYAGVPIVSRNGHKIGVYAVSDECPRDGLSAEDVQFMENIAQVVMEHLEWARDRVDRFKGERIVRGLAAFIEGGSTGQDESVPAKEASRRSSSTVRPPEMTLGSGTRYPLTRGNSEFRIPRHGSQGTSPPPSPAPTIVPSPVLPQNVPLETPSQPTDPPEKSAPRPKPDGLSRMYYRAAEILRHSTLADGVILLGATATTAKQMSRIVMSGGIQPSDEEDMSMPGTSGSEGVGFDSSDSDASPSARPCKILSYSLANERASAEIEQGPALSLGILEKYFSLFPRGKAFSFTEEGVGVSSEDDSASDRESGLGRGRRRRARMDHKELLQKIPGAKAVVFVPLYDYAEDRFAGGCFLWTSILGRMMNLDEDLSYLRAFGNSIMSQVGRINMLKNEAAKTTFIASMSHELRSPLHGILGAVEFLKDTKTSSYQADLVNSISTCGKTLLDTLNHVLDYSKINKLGRVQMRRGARQNKLVNLPSDSMESMNMTAVLDMAVLVEEVVDSIAAGHTFKKLPFTGIPEDTSKLDAMNLATSDSSVAILQAGAVSVLLDICPRTSWMVKTQPGALRRIIMNLFGNALKYTSAGSILVSLRGQVNADETKVDALIRVVDTGKGMSDDFQRNRLFVPFSQEDPFQPGTGLGLSIVKQIVDSLGGSLEVKSQQDQGTEVDVRIRLNLVPDDTTTQPDEQMLTTIQQTKGLSLRLSSETLVSDPPPLALPRVHRLNETITETCSSWFGMKVLREDETADELEPDMYMYCEPPPAQVLEQHFRKYSAALPGAKEVPIVIVCPNAEEAVRISQIQNNPSTRFSEIVEVISQPCGPRKLARAFSACLGQAKDLAERPQGHRSESACSQDSGTDQSVVPDVFDTEPMTSIVRDGQPTHLDMPPTTASGTFPKAANVGTPPTPPTPVSMLSANSRSTSYESGGNEAKKAPAHVLLVDDNQINLRLLIMFMKKCGFTYQEAENGQEAIEKYKEACGVPQATETASESESPDGRVGKCRFDFVLMDISMPVMNGLEATKHIRDFEREHNLPATYLIALTGLASLDARRDAKSVGVDIFLPKPVRFAELKKLLATK